MKMAEKSGEVDVTTIYVQMDEAKNQIVGTENQMVNTEKEVNGRKAILEKVSDNFGVTNDQNVVEVFGPVNAQMELVGARDDIQDDTEEEPDD